MTGSNYLRSVFALCACLASAIATTHVQATIFPADGAVLNYRIVGFAFPKAADATNYKIEIEQGDITDEHAFRAQITTPAAGTNRVIAEVPQFASDYTWRILYRANNRETRKSTLYHFSTGSASATDTSRSRLRVTLKAHNTSVEYVVLNGCRTMYDLDGNPVWYLPDIKNLNFSAQDIKYTAQHTLTLIYGTDALEVNYAGKLLWESPSGAEKNAGEGGAVMYHHEFTRLPNGNYMALGTDKPPTTISPAAPAGAAKPISFFPKTNNSTLYEYSPAGNIVWSWSCADYLSRSDIEAFSSTTPGSEHIIGHENSFYFDQKQDVVYLSFLTYNRIIKIEYPSGKVLSTYGRIYTPGIDKTEPEAPANSNCAASTLTAFRNNLFLGQHSCRPTKDGDLMIYNNNIFTPGKPPEIERFKEEGKEGKDLERQWVYQCPTGNSNNNGGGGCVSELPDGSMFVSMNAPHNTVFIVNRDKQLLWSAQPEERTNNNEWQPLASYRASTLTQADLEDLIWASEGVKPEPMSARQTKKKHGTVYSLSGSTRGNSKGM